MAIGTRGKYVAVIALVTLLAACGIDQGGSPAQEETAQSGAVTYGPIDGFGSIIVNGDTIGTSSATVTVNGVPAAEADLSVGQIVRVESIVDSVSNDAVAVAYQANVIGPVATVDAQAGALTVLGQDLVTDAATRIDVPGVAALADLAAGTIVEISALERPGGSQLVRYIGVPSDPNRFVIATTISSIDTAALQFTLGGATVDYSQVNVLDVPGGIPAVGLTVLAVGTALGNAGELVADQVLALGTNPGLFSLFDTDLSNSAIAPSVSAEFTDFSASFVGFIETSNNSSLLTINNVIVSFGADTTIVGGEAVDLNAGVLVRVRGDVTSPGNVSAAEISIL